MEVALDILDQRLEVKVGQPVHHLEHDVLKHLFVELGRASEDSHVATMLGQAAIGDNVVLVVGLDDVRFEPLVTTVANEALAVRNEVRAIELSMAAVVRAESRILADSVLHHAAAAIHLRVQYLSARPLVLREGCLVDMHDLVPGAHDVLLGESLSQRSWTITGYVLTPNL